MSQAHRKLSRPPTALVRHPDGKRWWHFPTVREVLVAGSLDEVSPVLAAADRVTAEGGWAVGFCTYESSPAFDPALVTQAPTPGLPLAWFALCDPPITLTNEELPTAKPFTLGALDETVDARAHRGAVEKIRRWIARGDTYQVNYTYRLEGQVQGDIWGLFLALERSQGSAYAAWLNTGSHLVCSTSPELFFELEGDRLRTRPMKGTAPRGRTNEEDAAMSEGLATSAKDRAENVMIVDMIRNDLGRVALPGSVRTTRLFDVERYPTIFQMTSTIEARTRAGAAEVFAALFPCASITGAPKVRTTELIHELENAPRGIYTGAIGWMAPERRARFSVAIRTATVAREDGRLRYGTGGGIVWDSVPESEYAECLQKARILTSPRPEFELLETILWRPHGGFFLLERHLDRLVASAVYFDYPIDRQALADRLRSDAATWRSARRIRLTLAADGTLRLEAPRLPAAPEAPIRLQLAAIPIDSTDPFVFHKTTHREVYDHARAAHPEADDVLLWNERGELTESTIANLVVELDGELFTPPIDCGLLGGTLRAELLAEGEINERVLTRADLDRCSALYLVNSVRGRRAAILTSDAEQEGEHSDSAETPDTPTP